MGCDSSTAVDARRTSEVARREEKSKPNATHQPMPIRHDRLGDADVVSPSASLYTPTSGSLGIVWSSIDGTYSSAGTTNSSGRRDQLSSAKRKCSNKNRDFVEKDTPLHMECNDPSALIDNSLVYHPQVVEHHEEGYQPHHQLYYPSSDNIVTVDRPVTPDGEECEEPGRIRQSMSLSISTAAAKLKCILHSQPDDEKLDDPVPEHSPSRCIVRPSPAMMRRVQLWRQSIEDASTSMEGLPPPVVNDDETLMTSCQSVKTVAARVSTKS